jgi:hypothetical protein
VYSYGAIPIDFKSCSESSLPLKNVILSNFW